MKKQLNKTLAFFLAALMISNLSGIDVNAAPKKKKDPPPVPPVVTVPEDVIQTGTCGQNAKYSLNETTGVLTISVLVQ